MSFWTELAEVERPLWEQWEKLCIATFNEMVGWIWLGVGGSGEIFSGTTGPVEVPPVFPWLPFLHSSTWCGRTGDAGALATLCPFSVLRRTGVGPSATLLLVPRFLFPPTGEGETGCGSGDGGSFLGVCAQLSHFMPKSPTVSKSPRKDSRGLSLSVRTGPGAKGSRKPGFWLWLHQSPAE